MFLCCLVTLSGFRSKLNLIFKIARKSYIMKNGFLAHLACFVGNPGIIKYLYHLKFCVMRLICT